jgi:secreted trypsin-like serine protease
MMLTISKTFLLFLLAASSVSAQNLRAPEIPTPEIVGGNQAKVGDYPYYGTPKQRRLSDSF